MKHHPADGANIVAKFGRLREAVPLIRHHHERWDGTGYPRLPSPARRSRSGRRSSVSLTPGTR